MPAALKRKSEDEEYTRPSKSVKLELGTPGLFGALTHYTHAPEQMDVDMDMDADTLTPSSADSSPVTTPSAILASYPNLQIYTPLNPLESSTPLDTPTHQTPFFEAGALTSMRDIYPQQANSVSASTLTCSCERIPRLRMSCAKPNGDRSLWRVCDGCGATAMVA